MSEKAIKQEYTRNVCATAKRSGRLEWSTKEMRLKNIRAQFIAHLGAFTEAWGFILVKCGGTVGAKE